MVILRSSEHLKECLVLQTNAKHPSEIVPSVLKVTSIWVGQVNRLPRGFAAQEGWCGVLLCQTHLGKRIHFQYNFSALLDPWISKLDPSQWWALCTQLALVSFSLMGVSTCSPCSWCFPAWNKVPLALQPCSRMINLLNPTLHPTQSFPWLPLYNVTQRQESFAGQCQPGRARARARTRRHILWEMRRDSTPRCKSSSLLSSFHFGSFKNTPGQRSTVSKEKDGEANHGKEGGEPAQDCKVPAGPFSSQVPT